MPDVAEIIKTAVQHYQAGRLQQARRLYELILQSNPDHPIILHSLGVINHQTGDNDSAVELISKAISKNSQVPQFYNNLAVALKSLGRFEEAIDTCEKALQLKPDYADACYNMANALASLGRCADALEKYRKALSFKSDDPFIYYNIGVAMQKLDQHAEAVENFRRTIRLNHNAAEVYSAMAASQQVLGQYTEAIDSFRRALRLKPDSHKIHADLGMVLLKTGDFIEGWNHYCWRLCDNPWLQQYNHKPCWDGSNFQGKRLIIRCEQGLGDNIQFIRYLPMVKARGGTVIFEVYNQLRDLLKSFAGIDQLQQVRPDSKPSTEFDYYSALLDLPRIFGTTPQTIPADVPYIYADPIKVEYWRDRLNSSDFKVGIVWAGNPSHTNDHHRSCKLEEFRSLAEIPSVRLYSLQKGAAAEQIKDLTGEITITNLADELGDLSDTAAVIENLDLIISVDTAALHLAGAMGRPTWAVFCATGDWRWLAGRDDSPWYPTIRIFQQEKLGDWKPVFQVVADELKTAVTSRKSANQMIYS